MIQEISWLRQCEMLTGRDILVAKIGVGYSLVVLKPFFIVMMWMTGCGCVFAAPIDDLFKQLDDPEWNKRSRSGFPALLPFPVLLLLAAICCPAVEPNPVLVPFPPTPTNAIDALLGDDASKPEVIRAQFIEVERVARMDHGNQKAHLRRIYFTLLPEFERKRVIGLSMRFPLIEESGTPEQVADRFLADRNTGAAELNSEALSRCREILKRHPNQVGPWLWEDAGCGKNVDLAILSKDYFGWLSGLLSQPDDKTAARAAHWLSAGQAWDPRAISLIIRRFPSLRSSSGARFDLELLQEGRSANPDLIRLLSSPDAGTRLLAAKALSRSGDPILSSWGTKLLQDPDEEIRRHAETMMHCIEKRKEKADDASGLAKQRRSPAL